MDVPQICYFRKTHNENGQNIATSAPGLHATPSVHTFLFTLSSEATANVGRGRDTMYLHPVFKIDTAEALPMLKERAFGLLVVPTGDAPFGVHVPFLIDETPGGSIKIALHVASANPIHTHIGDGCKVLLACSGPDAYLSPDWYESENQVPSWLYTSVHVTGTAKIVPAETHLDHVNQLARQFESRLAPKQPWNSEKMSASKRANMLEAIVAISIDVEAIHAQKKLVQHKSEADQLGAAAGMRGCGDSASREIADLIEAGIKG